MAVGLDHIVIPSRDKVASSRFLAEILGLDPPRASGHFMALDLANGVTLDYDDREDFHRHHCAFRVGVEDFNGALERLAAVGVTHYADPGHQHAGEINRMGATAGFYFDDPDGHNMEVFTDAVAGVADVAWRSPTDSGPGASRV